MQDNLRDLIRCSPWNGRFLLEKKIQVVRHRVEMSTCCQKSRLVDSWNDRFVCVCNSDSAEQYKLNAQSFASHRSSRGCE